MENWVTLVVLFSSGIIFLLLEIFVLPGFGISGIVGTGLIIASIAMSFYYSKSVDYAIYFTIGTFITTVAVIYFSLKLLKHTKLGKQFILTQQFTSDKGFVAKDQSLEVYLGKKGTTQTALKPYGKIKLLDGEIIEVVSESNYIEPNIEVIVTKIDTNVLYVDKEQI